MVSIYKISLIAKNKSIGKFYEIIFNQFYFFYNKCNKTLNWFSK